MKHDWSCFCLGLFQAWDYKNVIIIVRPPLSYILHIGMVFSWGSTPLNKPCMNCNWYESLWMLGLFPELKCKWIVILFVKFVILHFFKAFWIFAIFFRKFHRNEVGLLHSAERQPYPFQCANLSSYLNYFPLVLRKQKII